MITPFLLIFFACTDGGKGVEETGYLTQQGVLFTEDDAGDRWMVVQADAVEALGGVMTPTLSTDETLPPKTLTATGAVWRVDQAESVLLEYELDAVVDDGTYTVEVDDGLPPFPDPQVDGQWVIVLGDHLQVSAGILVSEYPLLVVNTSIEASIVVVDDTPTELEGGIGDTVCVSRLEADVATASTCVEAQPLFN